MLFHSFPFFFLFSFAFICNYFIPSIRIRTCLLLLISYFFYVWDDPQNIIYILFSTVIDFYLAKIIYKSGKIRYLIVSIFFNFGLLFFFKSQGIFSSIFSNSFPDLTFSEISLPLGISFYTFQTVSYVIDVYRKKIVPEKSLFSFALYVSFFPQLIAGPIERGRSLIPQLSKYKKFIYLNFKIGLQIFTYGLIKKLVIADRAGFYGEKILNNWVAYSAFELLIGGYLIVFQYYCDFSAYSEMALGLARMLGIKLSINFKSPFLSRSPLQFWRHWHITLMNWLYDYILSPLLSFGLSYFKILVSILLVFLFAGIWHGVGLNFAIWGLLNGLAVIITILLRKLGLRGKHKALIPIQVLTTFHIFVFTGLFLHFKSFHNAYDVIIKMTQFKSFSLASIFKNMHYMDQLILPLSIALLMIAEIVNQRANLHSVFNKQGFFLRWSVYFCAILVLVLFSFSQVRPYVYFRF